MPNIRRGNIHKTGKSLTALLLTAFLLTGCGDAGNGSAFTGFSSSYDTPTNGNISCGTYGIMRTDTGYYYIGPEGTFGIHYFDEATGLNVYLCNKPECTHSGEETCTATSDRYAIMNACLYEGKLYFSVLDYESDGYAAKLLRAEPDGSGLTELVTYYAMDGTTVSMIYASYDPTTLLIYQDKAILQYRYFSESQEDVNGYGTVLYDLNTGAVTQISDVLDEEKGCKNFTIDGDYIYFNKCFTKGRRNRLHRLNVKDDSIEEITLKNKYNGKYCIVGDVIYYTDGFANLHSQNLVDGTSASQEKFFRTEKWKTYTDEEGNIYQYLATLQVVMDDVYTDGEYIYVAHGASFHGAAHVYYYADMDRYDEEFYDYQRPMVVIYDLDWNMVGRTVLFPRQQDADMGDNIYMTPMFSVRMLDDMVYIQMQSETLACSKEDFLKGGVAPFTTLYVNAEMVELQ